MTDFRLEVRVKNARLYNAIKGLGYETVKDFCSSMKINYNHTNSFINLKVDPLEHSQTEAGEITGSFKGAAIKIAEAVGMSPDELWPDELRISLKKNTVEKDLSISEINRLMPSATTSIEYDIDGRIDRDRIMASVIDILSEREKKVIEMRFGLNGNIEHTLESVSAEFGVQRERIRQIEAKALRKMRNKGESIIKGEAR